MKQSTNVPLIFFLLVLVMMLGSCASPAPSSAPTSIPTPTPTSISPIPTTTSTPSSLPPVAAQSHAAIWAHLRSLAQGEHGKAMYDAVRDNIWWEYFETCNGKDWWEGPRDSWYLALEIRVDTTSGTKLLPPNALVSTVVATGENVVYFGWVCGPDGGVYPYNPYAMWLEEELRRP